MPSSSTSKSKKKHSASKAPPDPFSSPSTPSMDSSQPTHGSLLAMASQASNAFPSLISDTAFIARITHIHHDYKGDSIWLSDSSMLASSFSHGSLVSVSIPLSSVSGYSSLQAGSFFALAKVFCSTKILNDGVRLSSNLSSTMGDPPLGGVVFVYPVQIQVSRGLPTNREDRLLVSDCGELYLEFVCSKRVTTTSADSKISSKTSYGSENGSVSASPRTPMNQIKATSRLSSPIGEDSVDNLANANGLSIDLFDIKELFGEEGSTKRLMETWVSPWLYSRTLLCGNLVTVPILSQICTFQVIDAKRLVRDDGNHYLTNGSGNDLQPEVSDSVEHLIEAFVIQRETKVCLKLPSKLVGPTSEIRSLPRVNLDSINVKSDSGDDYPKLGGLSKEYGILKDIIVMSSMSTLSSIGLRPIKGVLLHGPPGTGKTCLARLCIRDAGVNIFSVNGPELVSQYHGESERALHEVFESAHQAAPAVVFIDELDAIAPSRKDGGEELSQRMVATLLNLMDGVGRTEGIVVIAATNRPDSIEPALRRPGRLDREIEIGVPSPKQRLDIFLSLLCDMEHSLSDVQIKNLAVETHGFVGADLAALCNEAALICLRRYVYSRNSHETSNPCKDSDVVVESDCLKHTGDNIRDCSNFESSSISTRTILDDNIDYVQDGIAEEPMLKVTFKDFEKAKMKVRPSAMREIILEVPKVRWEDVGGQREVKSQLMEAVEWPQKHQDAFKRIGTRPPTGVLLFGPPGCSKTLMARAVASEAGLNFFAVKGPELFSKWVGESEKAVGSLFAKARANAPSIIFFDEIDSLASVRGKENEGVSVSDRVISQLLVEMDGLHQRLDVTVIAATNRPDKIDSALLRPGRFDRLLYVGPPKESDREEILQIHLRKIPCSSDVNIKELSSLTEGFTGADISSICREAALKAMEENILASEVTMQHLKASIEKVQPSTTQSYHELRENFQRLVHSNGKEKTTVRNAHDRSNWFPLWNFIKSYVLSPAASIFGTSFRSFPY